MSAEITVKCFPLLNTVLYCMKIYQQWIWRTSLHFWHKLSSPIIISVSTLFVGLLCISTIMVLPYHFVCYCFHCPTTLTSLLVFCRFPDILVQQSNRSQSKSILFGKWAYFWTLVRYEVNQITCWSVYWPKPITKLYRITVYVFLTAITSIIGCHSFINRDIAC